MIWAVTRAALDVEHLWWSTLNAIGALTEACCAVEIHATVGTVLWLVGALAVAVTVQHLVTGTGRLARTTALAGFFVKELPGTASWFIWTHTFAV